MNLDGTQQLQAGASENTGAVGTVTQTPENIRRIDPGATTTTTPTAAGTGPPVYQATRYGGTQTAPMRTFATEMIKITPETKRKNAREIFKFLNKQGSELWDLHGDYTLFIALITAT